jgi:hypothetical protein
MKNKSLLIGLAVVVAVTFGVLIGLHYSTLITTSIPALAQPASGSPQTVETPKTVATEQPVKEGMSKYITVDSVLTKRIDNFVAPAGYQYAIITLDINNTGTETISTNPFFWEFTADGVIYQADLATFSDSIHTQSVDVGPGGHVVTKLVYLVPDTIERGKPYDLKYTGPTTRY